MKNIVVTYVPIAGLLLVLAVCGRVESDAWNGRDDHYRVVNGTDVAKTAPEFMFIGKIVSHLRRKDFAGTGTLLCRNVVLTAGHVAADVRRALGRRGKGAEFIVNGVAYKIKSATTLARPSHSTYTDVGILVLEKPVPAIATFPKIAETPPAVPLKVRVFGNGKAGILKLGNLLAKKLNTIKIGDRAFGELEVESADNAAQATEEGDSGGPIFEVLENNGPMPNAISRIVAVVSGEKILPGGKHVQVESTVAHFKKEIAEALKACPGVPVPGGTE